MTITELMEKRALSPVVSHALGGALGGGLTGAGVGAVTGKEGTRKKRALIGAGLGAVASGIAQGHLAHKLEPAASGIKRALGASVEQGIAPSQHLVERIGVLGKRFMGHPSQYLGGGLGGALVGGGLGAGMHKLVGGKKENRGKAGTIGAALGGAAGLAAIHGLNKFVQKHGSYKPFSICEAMEKHAEVSYPLLGTGIGALMGAGSGAIAGAASSKKGKRWKGAGIGALLGGTAGGIAGHMTGKAHVPFSPDMTAKNMLSTTGGQIAGRALGGVMGAGAGGALAAGGHKLVGGKAENRHKAGRIGAGLGGLAGAIL